MPTTTKKITPRLYIAAIGASAGGLEALQKLVSHLPAGIKNIAFVIVQHLSPNYKSMLVQSLSNHTGLKVVEVKNTVPVNAGTIYITPPDKEIIIKKGKLYLAKSTGAHGPRPSIDALLHSLAADQKEKSIGVILSGTGSDGADGIKAIKRAGGITLVQEPRSAKYNSMPLAAIDTGMIDFILTPEKMGEQFKLLTSDGKQKPSVQSASDIRDTGYREIIEVLAKETGTDFTNYKHNTLYRRITKRLAELKLDTTKQYLKFIDKNPGEVDELYNNVLIGVTSFFRDPAVFRALEKKIAALVDSKMGNEALRIWVPGCATGEEVYSIGIVIASVLKKKNRVLAVQIFATDINEQALSFARKGVYQQKTLRGVPSEIIKNYFIRHNGYSEVSKNIRSMILFSKHDLTHNPPFLKLDLIVCRNLLIYFNNKLQEYVFPVFYSALNPNGYLLLGKSESIGQFNDLFSVVNRESKIYQRKTGTSLHRIRYTPVKLKQTTTPEAHKYDFSISEMVKETIFKLFEYPYVVINDNMDIQEISGDVSPYLGLKQGQMNANLLKLAHKDLRIEIRSLINKCSKENKEAKGNTRKIVTEEKEYFVKVSVRPLLYSVSPNEFYLIVFEEIKKDPASYPKTYTPAGNDDARRIKELELELDATKEDLQEFVERLENSNSELQSLNEEMQSTNEELKISNEELETANEELQSTNEEINIAYNELKAANEKLEKQERLIRKSEANVQAMLGNTLQAFILMDKDYLIIAFNKVAVLMLKKLFGITFSEGDNFHKLFSKKEFEIFSEDFKTALKGKTISAEKKISDKKGNSFSFIFNFTPVKDYPGNIESISFSILDITELKKTKTELSKSEQLVDSVFHTADIGIAIIDSKGLFVKVNDGLCKLLGFKQTELIEKPYLKIIPGPAKKESVLIHKQYFTGNVKNIECEVVCKDGSIMDCYITNNLFIDEEGGKFLVKTFRDISESKRYKELLQEAEKSVHMGAYEYDIPSKKIIWTDEMYSIYEVKKGFIPTIEKMNSMYTKESRAIILKLRKNALRHVKNFDTELEMITVNKKRKWVRVTGMARRIKSKTIKLVGTVQDITLRKEAELRLQQLSFVADKTNNSVLIMDAFGKIEWVNDSFAEMTGYEMKEVIGKTLAEILQMEGTDKAVIKKITDCLKKELPVTEAIRNYRKDGTAFWINMEITPVFKDGKLINFIGLGVDITELIEAKESQKIKEALEQQQRLFTGIAKNFPDGIIGVLDKNLNYVFAGGAEIKKLGLTPGHLIGEHIFDALSYKSNSEAEPFLRKAFAGENVIFEEELNGNTYVINAVPLFFGEKQAEQLLVVLYNITNRKKAEEEVWQALNKQKELNELKSKFVSIASHEFRTPLSGILSSAYLIAKYNDLHDDKNIQKHLERITGSVRTLTDILNDFLSLGKMEEGKTQNNIAEFNVVDFCKSLTEEIRPTIKKNQAIIYQHSGKGDIVSLDKQNLRHVLMNLISNAVKYSDEGKPIHLTSSLANGQIQFTVKDEGIGIPAEDQPYLFQTFFRANNTTNIQGTGMGLYIVKRYTEIMGGTIQFASRENEGTAFTLQFPAAKTGSIN
jgi:two-component system, chemotaxis family, CheB/CheR fusion protein